MTTYTQPEASGCLFYDFVSNEHLSGVDCVGPYPTMNHVASSTIGYDDPPHLATVPGGHPGNQSHLLDGYSSPGITQLIPFPPGAPPFEYYAPAIPEVPIAGPIGGSPSQLPLPHNVAGSFRGNPNPVHFGMPVTEDLKYIASHYLHNSGSYVDKLRVRRSRSGAVKVLVFLDISIASGTPRLEYHTPMIPEVPYPCDGPSSHVPLPHNVSGPSRGNPSLGHSTSGMSVIEDLKDVASHCLRNPSSHVDKIRMRRSRSGDMKVLIILVMGDTM